MCACVYVCIVEGGGHLQRLSCPWSARQGWECGLKSRPRCQGHTHLVVEVAQALELHLHRVQQPAFRKSRPQRRHRRRRRRHLPWGVQREHPQRDVCRGGVHAGEAEVRRVPGEGVVHADKGGHHLGATHPERQEVGGVAAPRWALRRRRACACRRRRGGLRATSFDS